MKLKLLATFPGKFGDLMWGLPSIRALSRAIGAPVDLMLARDYASIVPLLKQQPYIGSCWADQTWETFDTAPMTPRLPPVSYSQNHDAVLHLGYRAWPKQALPYETLNTLQEEWVRQGLPGVPPRQAELCLDQPWVQLSDARYSYHWNWVHGFTDEHFELKYGLVQLLERKPQIGVDGGLPPCKVGSASRWEQEVGESPLNWEDTVAVVRRSAAFLGCCSALHVLAVAVGTPVVCYEPNPHRHHPIFYPLGTEGPQVHLVRGNDGLPTQDSRHTRELLQRVLEGRR